MVSFQLLMTYAWQCCSLGNRFLEKLFGWMSNFPLPGCNVKKLGKSFVRREHRKYLTEKCIFQWSKQHNLKILTNNWGIYIFETKLNNILETKYWIVYKNIKVLLLGQPQRTVMSFLFFLMWTLLFWKLTGEIREELILKNIICLICPRVWELLIKATFFFTTFSGDKK